MSFDCFKSFVLNSCLQTDQNLTNNILETLCETYRHIKLVDIKDKRLEDGRIKPNEQVNLLKIKFN